MVRRFFVACTVLLLLAGAAAPAAGLTPEQVFALQPPWGAQPSHILWAPDASSFLYVLPSQDGDRASTLHQYDVRTDESRDVVDPAQYPGKPETPSNVSWSPDARSIAFTIHGTLYVRDMATGLDRTVAKDVKDALWSPQGGAIAYTHQADLYVAQLVPELHVTRLTAGGTPGTLLHGDLDWVYPEELNTQHGFAWSPDGREIAYMTMDERPVTDFPIVDFLPYDNKVTYERYPLAGEQNPRVSLHVVDIETQRSRQLYDAGSGDEYMPWFAWKPASHTLLAEFLDRAQQHARVLAWEQPGDAPATVYSQSERTWVDSIAQPEWLPGGQSLWVLPRENAAGLYLRSTAGALRRLTGSYRVFELLGADPKSRTAFVTAAYPTRRDRSLLAIAFDGGPPRNLTPEAGSHAVSLSPNWSYFVDTHSSLNDPPQTDLLTVEGELRATLARRNDALKRQLLPVQMLNVDSPYGKLDAYIIRPANFDPAHRYPVIVYAYGGPDTPTTADVFGTMRGLYHQLLAQHGFIVFSIDGPGSQVDDAAHVRMLYHNFGPASLLGQRIGVQYLRSLPYVDASRIGIWGWSFGGYETVYALTHSDLFKAGAAGAPVTDWHLYDSIYTERYMGTPQGDAKGYEESSDVNAAANLRGDLLVSHGTSDDNVHMANTIAMLDALAGSGKTNVGFMAYAGQKHGFTSLADLRQLYEHMLEWWTQHL
jgi:dipeptidyl-peptidase-4